MENQADYCVNSFKGHTKKFGFSSTYMESHQSVLSFSGLIRSYNIVSSFPQLHYEWKVKVLVAQLCLTLCDPMDYSSPGSSGHGILQAGILQWVAFPFSRGSSQPRDQTRVSCIADRYFTI